MAACSRGAPYRVVVQPILPPLEAPPPPPRLVLPAANMLQATEIREWERKTATEERDTQFTLAYFHKRGAMYDDALSCLGGLRGPLLLMLPSHLVTLLRCELEDHTEQRQWAGR